MNSEDVATLAADDPGNPAASGREVTLNSDGSVTYTPPPGFIGTDWFSYRLTNSQGLPGPYQTIFVDVVQPTVSVSALLPNATFSDPSGKQQDGYLEFSRTCNANSPALTANATYSGAAVAGQDYQALPPTVNFPAGQSSVVMPVVPVNGSPDSASVVDAAIAAGAGYASNASAAHVNVAAHGFSAVLGDGSNNVVIRGSSNGTPSTTPLVLIFPANQPAGSTITLVPTDSGILSVFQNGTLIPWVNGAIVLPVPSAQSSITLEVAAAGSSTKMNDLWFAMTDTEPAVVSATVLSNPATAVTLLVHALSFGGDGEQEVTRDTGVAYSSLQWDDENLNGKIDGQPNLAGTIDNGDEADYPLSYVRSLPGKPDVMQVTVYFADPLPIGTQVEGVTSYDGITFSPVTVDSSDQQRGGTVLTLIANAALPATIDSASLSINWEYLINGNRFTAVEQTSNRLYVTGSVASGAPETVLYIGCTAAAGLTPRNPGELDPGGSGADQQVVGAIWHAFSTLSVKRVNGVVMQYHHLPTTTYNALQMLADPQGLGQCTAWADLFMKVLSAQGETSESVRVTSPDSLGYGFTVNLVPAQGSNGANYDVGTGPAPQNAFNFHQIVYVDAFPDRIFDPSYGIFGEGGSEDAAKIDWENKSLNQFLDANGVWQVNTPAEDLIYSH